MISSDHVFMSMARDFSALSKCAAKQVGCLAVRDGRILCTGVNGTAPGYTNCNELFDKDTLTTLESRARHHEFSERYELHAEMNTIIYAAKHGIPLNGSTFYCTLMPCFNCVKHISAAGVIRIVYDQRYDRLTSEDEESINYYCNKMGILLEQLL